MQKMLLLLRRGVQICGSAPVKPVTPTDGDHAGSAANWLRFTKKSPKQTLLKLSNGNQPCRKLWAVVLQVLSEFGALSFPREQFHSSPC